MTMPYLVVGAGFAGCIVARRLADAGKMVVVIDRREHIAGNAFDSLDKHGVLIHNYGPHIFHTNSERVVEFLTNFTFWRPYTHRSMMHINGKLVPFPVTPVTYAMLGITSPMLIKGPVAETAEEYQLMTMGREMTEILSRPYTKKQWNLDLSELAASVVSRNPPRICDDDRTFLDYFQKVPKNGYTAMFKNMLDHPNIILDLHTDYRDIGIRFGHTVFTGPIDEFYNYTFGKLPYRSMRFNHAHFDEKDLVQPCGTIGYPDLNIPFTRSTEHKWLTGQQCKGTTVTYEHSAAEGEPFYPIPNPANEQLYRRYRELAEKEKDVTFVGRLAQYRYYNMDQVAIAALTAADKLLGGANGS